MRNFKSEPLAGLGFESEPEQGVVPAGQVASYTADPERVAHLISVNPFGVHLTPLRPVELDGHGKHADKSMLVQGKGVNPSKVHRAGR